MVWLGRFMTICFFFPSLGRIHIVLHMFVLVIHDNADHGCGRGRLVLFQVDLHQSMAGTIWYHLEKTWLLMTCFLLMFVYFCPIHNGLNDLKGGIWWVMDSHGIPIKAPWHGIFPSVSPKDISRPQTSSGTKEPLHLPHLAHPGDPSGTRRASTETCQKRGAVHIQFTSLAWNPKFIHMKNNIN